MSIARALAVPVATAAAVTGADRYRKHFTARAHLWMLLDHGLAARPSLRRTHASISGDPTFWPRLGLPPTGVSRSQLARSSHTRPRACLLRLFGTLRAPVVGRGAARRLHVVDSSFLALSEKLAPWSRHGHHAAGVRLHLGVDLPGAIPTHVCLSGTKTPDIAAWRARDWAALAGWTVLMDGGYYSHADFAQLRAGAVSWICPLNAQARVVVTADRLGPWPPTAAGDAILADQTITLGSPNNRNGAVLPGLRLVTRRNRHGTVHRTVTDRGDLLATEVVALYRQRWQIELFFRFLKHQLGVLHPLGYSPDAVALTLLLALIVALVLVLLEAVRPANLADIGWAEVLATAVRAVIRDPGG